jgi:hypothetical protein
MTLLLTATISAAFAAAPLQVITASGPIAVDGALDEADWARATPAGEFLRYTPADGGAPPGRTEVRFLQDERHLYIGIRVEGTGYPIRSRVSPREQLNADDQVGIYLDTFGDERTGYIFYVNPAGVQQDIRFNNGQWNMDWNTVLRSRGQVTDDGYTIEVAIPFRSLRYPDGGDQTWGVILTRKVPSEGAKYAWPRLVRGHPRLLSQAAPLEGVNPSPRGAGLEILPVLAVRQDASREAAGEPLGWSGLDPWSEAVRPGLDLRLGLGTDTGVAATVNPDYSQVEGDAAQIDLNQRFAFYYPERRPFFLDGVDAFQDNAETLYTRSIVEPLYGMKVSGREGRYTVGALHALDLSPAPSVHEDGAPGFDEEALEDAYATNAFGRFKVDAFDGGYFGFTAADKRVLGSGAYNDVVGGDLNLPIGELWTLTADAGAASTGGGGEVLSGHNASLRVARSEGAGLSTSASVRDVGPGYRNEVGFQNQTGFNSSGANASYGFEPAAEWLDRVTPGIWIENFQEREGDHVRAAGIFQQTVIGGVYIARAEAQAFEQREGEVSAPGWVTSAGFGAEPTGWLDLDVNGSTGRELDYGELVSARRWELDAETTLRVGAGVRLDVTARWDWLTPDGFDTETAMALRSRFFWQFTNALGLRVIGQTITFSEEESVSSSASYLLTWLRNPGTEAYLGVTQGFTTAAGDTTLVEQTLFAKLTWLFRV